MLILILLLTLVSAPSWAATYYAGAVTNCGGVGQDPCGTVGGAATLADPRSLKTLVGQVTAGDTVILLCGTYYDSTVTTGSVAYQLTNSGTSSNPITFQARTPLCAHIVLYNDSATVRVWYIDARSYIVFDGLYFDGQLRIINCTGCEVKNSEFVKGAWDGSSIITPFVIGGCTGCWVHDNYVHDIAPRITAGLAGLADFQGGHNNGGILVFNGTNTSIFERNDIDGGGPQYVSYNGGVESGLYSVLWGCIQQKGGSTHDNIYRYNLLRGCRAGLGGMASTDGTAASYNEQVYQNVILNPQGYCIDFDHFNKDWSVHHNTCYGLSPSTGKYAYYFGYYDSSRTDNGGHIRRMTFYDNLYAAPISFSSIYGRGFNSMDTFSACRATNQVAPRPTLTAGTSGTLASGTYWVRISPVTSGVDAVPGMSMPVTVTGPNGSISVAFDRSTGTPSSYNIWYGTVEDGQTSYITVAATGTNPGDAQTATITGSGASTGSYVIGFANQGSFANNLAYSDYNGYFNVTNIATKNTGAAAWPSSPSTLASWQSNTGQIGYGGTCITAFDTHSITNDPQFIDANANNFRLAPTSPARNAGRFGQHMGAYPADNSTDLGPLNGYWSGIATRRNFDLWLFPH